MLQDVLNTSITSINQKQKAIGVASQNINNANDDSYTTKSIHTNEKATSLIEATRKIDKQIRKMEIKSNSTYHDALEQKNILKKFETTIGSPGNSSLLNAVIELRTELQAYINTNGTNKNNEKSAIFAMEKFASSINKIIANGANIINENARKISSKIQDANEILNNIHHISKSMHNMDKIGQLQIMDKQEKFMKDLSAIIDVTYYRDEDSNLYIQTNNINIYNPNSEDTSVFKFKNGGVFVNNQRINTTTGEIGGIMNAMQKCQENIDNIDTQMSDLLLNKINGIYLNSAKLQDEYKGKFLANDNIQTYGILYISTEDESYTINLNGSTTPEEIASIINMHVDLKAEIDGDILKIKHVNDKKIAIDARQAFVNFNDRTYNFNEFLSTNMLFVKNENNQIAVSENVMKNGLTPATSNIQYVYNIDNAIDIMEEIEKFNNLGLENYITNTITEIATTTKASELTANMEYESLKIWQNLNKSENGVNIIDENHKIQQIDLALQASLNVMQRVTNIIDTILKI